MTNTTPTPGTCDRAQFLADSDVAAFVGWLGPMLLKLPVTLKIKRSKFVPGGIDAVHTGLDQVLAAYRWKTSLSETGNWDDTVKLLRGLSKKLKDAKTDDEAFSVCLDILAFGGNRNDEVGARPFLEERKQAGGLKNYLEATREWFDLDDAVLGGSDTRQPKQMNSMLTKIHALNAEDGLPIYDSRVAVAIAALVEMWRIEAKRENSALPEHLRFRSADIKRTVKRRFTEAVSPGALDRNTDRSKETARQWAECKIRLAWIMAAVLENNPDLLKDDGGIPARMHRMEASLFMIGYDIRSIAPAEEEEAA